MRPTARCRVPFLFGSHSMFGVKLGTLYRGVVPFMVINAIGLLIITFVPKISLTLPGVAH